MEIVTDDRTEGIGGSVMPLGQRNTPMVNLLHGEFQMQIGHSVFAEIYASGTVGGAFVQAGWRVRPTNTDIVNACGMGWGVGSFWTEPGIYEIYAECPAYAVNHHMARLWDITHGVQLLLGTSAYAPAGVQSNSIIVGRIYGNWEHIRVEHYCQTTNAVDGMGSPCTFGVNEMYAFIEFHKVHAL